MGELVGLARVVGVLFDGGAEFFHGSCRFFQRAGLLFSTARQVVVALRNLHTGGGHALRALADLGHHLGQTVAHDPHGGEQTGTVASAHLHINGQVAGGNFAGHVGSVVGFATELAGDGAGQGPGDQATQYCSYASDDQHQGAG